MSAAQDPRAMSPTAFRRALLAWYRATARDLPWRRAQDPYPIWLSEVMLQQTQVKTVIPYFDRFLSEFPTVQHLAAADQDRVLKLWEGLGYYSRARSLHRAAQHVADNLAGIFPNTAEKWQDLPGVGRYTAAAIASIANNQPVAVVDGNVKRVLSRLDNIASPIDETATEARLWQRAEVLLTRSAPGDHNQAIMELGARICRPRNPLCGDCPVARFCIARASGRAHLLPVKSRAPKVLDVTAYAGLIQRGDRAEFLFVQRPARGLLAKLWALPMTEPQPSQRASEPPERLLEDWFAANLQLSVRVGQHLTTVAHRFTHRLLTLHVYQVTVDPAEQLPSSDVTIPTRWAPAQSPELALGKMFQRAFQAISSEASAENPT